LYGTPSGHDAPCLTCHTPGAARPTKLASATEAGCPLLARVATIAGSATPGLSFAIAGSFHTLISPAKIRAIVVGDSASAATPSRWYAIVTAVSATGIDCWSAFRAAREVALAMSTFASGPPRSGPRFQPSCESIITPVCAFSNASINASSYARGSQDQLYWPSHGNMG
jgi:hypothetical protein